MAITEVSISNRALIEVGADRINSLSEDNKRAKLCRELYEGVRDETLRAHPWNFATKRVELAQIEDGEPAFGFSYAYQLPSDCLRVLGATSSSGTDIDQTIIWKQEGFQILSNEPTLFIKYTAKITNTATFEPNFAKAVSMNLAATLAFALVQSATLKDSCEAKFKDVLREARSLDSQEGTPDEFYADDWLSARL